MPCTFVYINCTAYICYRQYINYIRSIIKISYAKNEKKYIDNICPLMEKLYKLLLIFKLYKLLLLFMLYNLWLTNNRI